MYMIESENVKITSRWGQILSINVSYSCSTKEPACIYFHWHQWPLPLISSRNQFMVIITHRYSKPTRTIFAPIISSTNVAHIPLNHCVIPHGSPDIIISDNGQQVSSKVSISLRNYLRVIKINATAYQPQTNTQVVCHIKTLVSRAHLCDVGDLQNWDIVVQPATYAYNYQTHRSTNVSTYILTLARPIPGSVTFESLLNFQQML